MSKLDQFADKHLRGMAKFNINCSDPGERKACGEGRKKNDRRKGKNNINHFRGAYYFVTNFLHNQILN